MRAAGRVVGWSVSVALHAGLAAVMLWPVSSAPRPSAAPARASDSGPKVEVFVADQPESGAAPGLKSFAAEQDPVDFLLDPGSSTLPLPGFTFDYAKVADRAALLFPFLSPGLSLDAFGLKPRDPSRRLYNSLTVAADSGRRSQGPLALSESRLQQVIDESWSRRDRWKVFDGVMTLAAAHDPEEGALPILFQRYVQQNALQPYADTTMRDPRLWAQLGLAADHVAFVGFISRYATEHPSTRATTELLFLLDKLAQASFDCLVTLLDIVPSADLRWTSGQSPQAYQLIENLLAYYRRHLERNRIDSPQTLRTYYDKIRLAILSALLQMTPSGYRAGDARYLIGTIYWRHDDRAAALQAWRGIVPDRSDGYLTAYSQILEAIQGGDDPRDPLMRRRIDRALDAELGRWRDFSYTRLRHFGYRFDTY